MAEAVRTVDDLVAAVPALAPQRAAIERVAAEYPLAIPRYYLALSNRDDPRDPILQLAVPQTAELDRHPWLKPDIFEEDAQSPVPGVVRRYGDRALLLTTATCAMYCRHCFRKRLVGKGAVGLSRDEIAAACDWFRAHPEVRDVILSGGDPLAVGDGAIERILQALRAVPSIEIIRVHTRMPVVLPDRITPELCEMLARYHPLYVNTHFNHPAELTGDAAAAVDRLTRAGIPVGNQAVLLKGINDDVDTIEALLRGLLRMRVRPYYLFQSDLAEGVEHLRTPVETGLAIMGELRRRMGGMGLPKFVADMPGGGKVPLEPTFIVDHSDTTWRLRNPEGVVVEYPDARPD
jgi:lysine 2,3-aminomutase